MRLEKFVFALIVTLTLAGANVGVRTSTSPSVPETAMGSGGAALAAQAPPAVPLSVSLIKDGEESASGPFGSPGFTEVVYHELTKHSN